jgi:hypothetical protein
MEPTAPVLLVLGLLVGVLSGLIGVGGGVVLVPALVLLFGLPQHLAQGTSLAMLLPPIGVLAVYDYYKRGHVDLRMAALLCAGFVVGGLLGAKLAGSLPPPILRRVFGVALLGVSLKMILS